MGRTQTIALSGLIVVIVVLATVFAQTPTQPPIKIETVDPHVQIFLGFLKEWDEKKLKFPAKAVLTPEFMAMIKERARRKPAGYETPEWQRACEARWTALPADFGPQLPLTLGAKLAIVSGLIDNMPLQIKPEREAMLNSSRVSLYAVLSSSQLKAGERRRSAITSAEIQESVASFLTSVYPICHAPQMP